MTENVEKLVLQEDLGSSEVSSPSSNPGQQPPEETVQTKPQSCPCLSIPKKRTRTIAMRRTGQSLPGLNTGTDYIPMVPIYIDRSDDLPSDDSRPQYSASQYSESQYSQDPTSSVDKRQLTPQEDQEHKPKEADPKSGQREAEEVKAFWDKAFWDSARAQVQVDDDEVFAEVPKKEEDDWRNRMPKRKKAQINTTPCGRSSM